MKISSKLLILLTLIAMLVGCFAACGPTADPCEHTYENGVCTQCQEEDPTYVPPGGGEEELQFVDYAAQLKFNPDSGKKWAYATVKSYIDGDTTHFYVDHSDLEEGYVKARYLGINTPESTGVVEPWGKKASNYTKTQLQKASNIPNGIII